VDKDEVQLMRLEFDAADKLALRLRALQETAVVDDDYPQMRYEYESALAQFISCMKANGRFQKGNRYGVVEA
jgi:hypothetical protein